MRVVCMHGLALTSFGLCKLVLLYAYDKHEQLDWCFGLSLVSCLLTLLALALLSITNK